VDYFWIVQAIGFVAFVIDTSTCHLKNGRLIMGISAFSLLFWTVHFYYLGALTGAFICLATAIRSTICLLTPTSARPYIFAAGLAVIVAVTIYSWQGPISILPCLGSISYCFSVLKPESARVQRFSWAASTSFWLIYGLLVRSYPEVTAALIGLSSFAVAVWRLDLPVLLSRKKV